MRAALHLLMSSIFFESRSFITGLPLLGELYLEGNQRLQK